MHLSHLTRKPNNVPSQTHTVVVYMYVHVEDCVCTYIRVYLATAVVIARDRRPDSRMRICRIAAKQMHLSAKLAKKIAEHSQL